MAQVNYQNLIELSEQARMAIVAYYISNQAAINAVVGAAASGAIGGVPALVKPAVTGSTANVVAIESAKVVEFSTGEAVSVAAEVAVDGNAVVTTGAVSAAFPLLEFCGAIVAGFGVGCLSYDAAPEFWTTVSNAVLSQYGIEPVDYETIKGMSITATIYSQVVEGVNKLFVGADEGLLRGVKDALKNLMDAPVPVIGDVTTSTGTVIHDVYGANFYGQQPVLSPGAFPMAQITEQINNLNVPDTVKQDTITKIQNWITQNPTYRENWFPLVCAFEYYSNPYYPDLWNRAVGVYLVCNYADDAKFEVLGPDGQNHVYVRNITALNGSRATGVEVFSLKSEYLNDWTPAYNWAISRVEYKNDGVQLSEFFPLGYESRSGIQGDLQKSSNLLSMFGGELPEGVTQDYEFNYEQDLSESRPQLYELSIPSITPTGEVTVKLPIEMPALGESPLSAADPSAEPEAVDGSDPVTNPYLQNVVQNEAEPQPQPQPQSVPQSQPRPPKGGGSSAYYIPDYQTDCGIFAIYNPTLTEVRDFSRKLWSTTFIEDIIKLLGDPYDAVISLQKVFVTPETTSAEEEIVCGYVHTGVNSKKVTNQYARVDCGKVEISPYYFDVRDYSGYTGIMAYLPFCGLVNLDVNEVMNKTLHIYYVVDIITGACVCNVGVIDRNGLEKVLYMFNGNAMVQLPITSGSHVNIVRALLGVGTAVITGNAVAGIATGALNGAVAGTINRSGTITANVGAMSPKKPYILITRRIPYDTDRNVLTESYGENKPYSNLQSVVGTGVKVTVSDFWPNSNDMESNELAKLRAILQTGVIIK